MNSSNKELLKFLLESSKQKLITIVVLILVIATITVPFCYFSFDIFISVFTIISGMFSIILTILLYDILTLNKKKQAKYWNDESQLKNVEKTLEWFKDYLMSQGNYNNEETNRKHFQKILTTQNLTVENQNYLLSHFKNELSSIREYIIEERLIEKPIRYKYVPTQKESSLCTDCEKIIAFIKMKR